MRIALVITGMIRNYKNNIQSWKTHLLDLHNVDVFFHTYNFNIYKGEKVHATISVSEVVNLLAPKKYMIENHNNITETHKREIPSQFLRRGAPPPESILNQLRSIRMAMKLKSEYEKSHNFVYDIVIKIRFDTVFYSSFCMGDVALIMGDERVILCGNSTIKNMLYKNACQKCIDGYRNDKYVCPKHDPISDIVLISNSKNMDIYSKIYTKYNDYIKQEYQEQLHLLKKHINCQKISLPNGNFIHYDVPFSDCPYPERILSKHLKDNVLLNYTMNLDTNRARNFK